MKKIVVYLTALTLIVSLSGCSYNSMVEKEELIKSSWAQVENAYQRRVDLIPNLVNTVKGAANFEKSTLTAVIEARAKATSISIDPTKLTNENIEQFQKAQEGLSGALNRLMVVSEQYPELKANQNFLELQSQLEGTENRITVERKKFNDAVNDYNTTIKKFPANMEAKIFGFTEKAYFKSSPGAEKAPTVNF